MACPPPSFLAPATLQDSRAHRDSAEEAPTDVSSGRLKGQAAFHQHHDWVTARVLRQADQPGLLGGSLSERLLQELSRSGLAVHDALKRPRNEVKLCDPDLQQRVLAREDGRPRASWNHSGEHYQPIGAERVRPSPSTISSARCLAAPGRLPTETRS
jgi:hypothetical protein